MNELQKWWEDHAMKEIELTIPKALEYGSNDLEQIGRAVTGIEDPKLATQAGIAFYAVGKIHRVLTAIRAGKQPSYDSWFDLGVYARMAQRVQEVGGWPAADLSSSKNPQDIYDVNTFVQTFAEGGGAGGANLDQPPLPLDWESTIPPTHFVEGEEPDDQNRLYQAAREVMDRFEFEPPKEGGNTYHHPSGLQVKISVVGRNVHIQQKLPSGYIGKQFITNTIANLDPLSNWISHLILEG